MLTCDTTEDANKPLDDVLVRSAKQGVSVDVGTCPKWEGNQEGDFDKSAESGEAAGGAGAGAWGWCLGLPGAAGGAQGAWWWGWGWGWGLVVGLGPAVVLGWRAWCWRCQAAGVPLLPLRPCQSRPAPRCRGPHTGADPPASDP
jgi:hypothetical protein